MNVFLVLNKVIAINASYFYVKQNIFTSTYLLYV